MQAYREERNMERRHSYKEGLIFTIRTNVPGDPKTKIHR
jgi:hypothetical protein